MKKILSFLILTMAFSALASMPSMSLAVTTEYGLDSTFATESGLEGTQTDAASIKATVGRVIKLLLGFLGILGVILILYAGLIWMTAGGDEGKVTKAKQLIINATIGIVIILAAYIITSFIITEVGTQLSGS